MNSPPIFLLYTIKKNATNMTTAIKETDNIATMPTLALAV